MGVLSCTECRHVLSVIMQALAAHPGSANFGAAAAKLKQGRGGAKAEAGRAPLHEPDRTSVVEKNNFKCPRCYKVSCTFSCVCSHHTLGCV